MVIGFRKWIKNADSLLKKDLNNSLYNERINKLKKIYKIKSIISHVSIFVLNIVYLYFIFIFERINPNIQWTLIISCFLSLLLLLLYNIILILVSPIFQYCLKEIKLYL